MTSAGSNVFGRYCVHNSIYYYYYYYYVRACRRRVNSRARKGDFFTQKGLNLMAGQIDTKILFIVSFIKSLFMRHVRACACRRLICVHTHTSHTPTSPLRPPKNKLIRVHECRHRCEDIAHVCVGEENLYPTLSDRQTAIGNEAFYPEDRFTDDILFKNNSTYSQYSILQFTIIH